IAYFNGQNVYVVNSDGTESRQLVTTSGRVGEFRWSPDGRLLRFTQLELGNVQKGSVWEVASDGSGLRPLLPGWNTSGLAFCGDWTRDGKYFLFNAIDNYGNGYSFDIWAIRERRALLANSNPTPIRLTS